MTSDQDLRRRIRGVLQAQAGSCCLDDDLDLERVVSVMLLLLRALAPAPRTVTAAVALADAAEARQADLAELRRDYIRAKYLERTEAVHQATREIFDGDQEEA